MVKKIVINKNVPKFNKMVACIGNFDGVHKGHQELIKRTVEIANKKGIVPSAICFNPDPFEVISKTKVKHLLSLENKIAFLEYFGIKQVIIIKFNNSLMNIKPIDFIIDYLNKMNIDTLICGFDFTYGYMGKGKPAQLKKYGNFKTEVIKEYKYYGLKISSTRIKEAISRRNFSLCNKLLGYTYTVECTVERCSKNGSKWLIQANIDDLDIMLPIDGEYGSIVLKDHTISMILPDKIKKNTPLLITFTK